MTTAAAIPFAGRTIIALEAGHFEAIRRTVEIAFRLAHGPRWQAWVDAEAPAHLRYTPGNSGVFMGYDFHITPEGPRLIEINTNAGGALLNGLHTAALCDPAQLACLCDDLLSVDAIEARLVGQFRAEHAAARGSDAVLRHVVIADQRPAEQFLYPEFELVRELFRRAGIEARIRDTSAALEGEPVDLVYLRDTDFTLEMPRTRALREGYLAGRVVVTPSPREYHLLGDKRRLTLLSSRAALDELGVAPGEAELLLRVVPETHLVAGLDPGGLWKARRELVFKPATAFGSRAVYRGDKITRGRFEAALAEPGTLAQQRVEPGEVRVDVGGETRAMKFDVRAYAYRDTVLLLGARVYHGQVMNLRTPGGGFSAICVVRGARPC